MKVILLQNVKNIGKKHEVKNVSDGYAQNNLFPRKLAIPATSESIARLSREIGHAEYADEKMKKNIETALQSLSEKNITIHAKANPQGILYAKIHAHDISKELQKIIPSSVVDYIKVHIPQETCDALGEYTVVCSGIKTTVTASLVVHIKDLV